MQFLIWQCLYGKGQNKYGGGEVMQDTELIEKVAEKNGTSKVEAAKAVNAVIGAMAETLKKGEKISLLELGSFAIRERKERNGYNPNSKENMVIPAKKVVKFSIGKYFFD